MNREFKVILVTFIAVSVFLSGFAILSYTGMNMTDGTGPGRVEIAADSTIVANETGFEMTDAKVHFSLYVGNEEQYEHVMLCLYDQNGTTLASRDLGTFSKPTDYTTVTVQADEIPRYIVVDHPHFRSYEFDYEVLVWNTDRERYEPGTPHDIEFQYPQSDTIGECP